MSARGLLLDLDDTLYDYAPAERHARARTLASVAEELGVGAEEAERLFAEARARVKKRVGDRGCSHHRLLYLLDLVQNAGKPPALARVRAWERAFWRDYLEVATLRPGALELLDGWRAIGGKIAVVTDQVAEVQLWKLEKLSLLGRIDAIAVSEEVERDKPQTAIFELAIARLGVRREDCVVVGDSDEKDGGGARALGLPYFQAESSERPGGQPLVAIARALGVAS
jgi:putative hydrolase of the HAD superfamily